MSVHVEVGKGQKSLMVDLNVVPFIDFLSCLIAFLMLGAVWTQVSALDLEQSAHPPNPVTVDPNPPPPPLTLHLAHGTMWIARDAAGGTTVPGVDGRPNWRVLRGLIAADRANFPDDDLAVINTDDGVPYEQMMLALDLTREYGYDQTMLAGGAPPQL